MSKKSPKNSVETIMTSAIVADDWSTVVSTTHIPEMDTGTGSRRGGRISGRRRLRLGALALGSFLTMDCRLAACALTCGYFEFILCLMGAMAVLGNPLRYFEVYLGQWSISGPGRAFRMVPVLDGIGIAMCMNAIVRAITCCAVAAIVVMYVTHSVADTRLPYTHCRDFDLNSYEAVKQTAKMLMMSPEGQPKLRKISTRRPRTSSTTPSISFQTVGFRHLAWRNITMIPQLRLAAAENYSINLAACKETFDKPYPSIYRTPPYNFFYVEGMSFRSEKDLLVLKNKRYLCCIAGVWALVWALLVVERLKYGRLIWNNVYSWLVAVPWIWTVALGTTAILQLVTTENALDKFWSKGPKQFNMLIGDALEIALSIHSSGTGSEIIHGKGLNHYASGHIDPHLGGENVLHSFLLLFLSAVHTSAAAACSLVEYKQSPTRHVKYDMRDSVLWILPMYSHCSVISDYTRLLGTLIFSGLFIGYLSVAFISLKSALHTIFEYRVKLVFWEQFLVAGLIISCFCLSILFTTNGGLPLLESVMTLTNGISIPLVCLLEQVALLYVYRSNDFVSDMNVATDENMCGWRYSIQWTLLPFITIFTLGLKIYSICVTDLPRTSLLIALVPLVCVLLAVPLRTSTNIRKFFIRRR